MEVEVVMTEEAGMVDKVVLVGFSEAGVVRAALAAMGVMLADWA